MGQKDKIIWHGAYGMKTKFDIEQLRYACTDVESLPQGYVEVLHIKDPPFGKIGFIVHSFWNDTGSIFVEFESCGAAERALPTLCARKLSWVEIARLDGYVRQKNLGSDIPWFYAHGEDTIEEDRAVSAPTL